MKASDFFNGVNGMSYRHFVWRQVESMEFDDLIIADLRDGDVPKFRMNLNKYASSNGVKFKTKLKDGDLYVGRVL